MSEVRRVVTQALRDTGDNGTAVLGAQSGVDGIVQWICFDAGVYMVEVVDPAKHRPGFFRRLFSKPTPTLAGLTDEQIRALEQLGFASGELGYEFHTYQKNIDLEQLVQVIMNALEIVGLDGEPISVDVF